MVKVYAVSLVLGFLGLVIAIFGAALAESLGRPGLDVGDRFGRVSKLAVGALAGFGMGGMSAEFSPLELGTGVSLLIAVAAAGIGFLWVSYAASESR